MLLINLSELHQVQSSQIKLNEHLPYDISLVNTPFFFNNFILILLLVKERELAK